MTEIKYQLNRTVFCIEASGHAGKAENGDDVCCAVSVLMQTTLQVLLDMQYHNELETLQYHMDKGDMSLFVSGKGRHNRKLMHCAQQLLTGLRLIEKVQPKLLQVVGVT